MDASDHSEVGPDRHREFLEGFSPQWAERLAKTIAVVERVDLHNNPPCVIQEIARDLAHQYERPTFQAPHLLERAAKLQKAAQVLLRGPDPDSGEQVSRLVQAGVSLDSMQAIITLAYSELRSSPARRTGGRAVNRGARALADAFATHYPVLTHRKPQVDASSDFVMHLSELFEILGFKAKAQHYAKQAVAQVRAEEQERERIRLNIERDFPHLRIPPR